MSGLSPAPVKRARAYMRCELAAGTSGGTSSAGIWYKRVINTIVENFAGAQAATLAADVVTLQPGTYWITCRVPMMRVGRFRARLVNDADASVLLWGGSVGSSYDTGTLSIISGQITLTAATAIRVESRADGSRGTYGLGGSSGSGGPEIYTEIICERVA